MANADLVRYIKGGIKGYYDRVPMGEIPLPGIGTVGIGQITDLRETLVVIKGIPNTGFNVEYLLAKNVEYFTANMSYNGSATFLGIDLASIEFGETYATVTIGSRTETYTSQNLDVLVDDLERFGLDPSDAQGLANAIGILWVTIPKIEEAVNEYLDGQDTTDLTGVDGAVHVNLDLGIGGTIESGTLVDIRNIQHVKGTLFDDEIIGSSETNILYGGEGADTLSGGAGHDDLYGGIGNDTIHGDDGAEILYDRGADDGIRDGETTEEYLTRLYAYDGDGNDTLEGGDGADVLVYSGGTDTFTGGAGDDTYFVVPDAQTSTNPNDQLTINVSGDFGHDTVVGTGAGIKEIVFDGLNSSDVTIRYHFEKISLATGDADSDNLFDWAHGVPGFGLGSYEIYKLAGSIEIIDNTTGSSIFVQDVYGSYLDGTGTIQDLSHIDTQFDLVFTNETITDWATLIDKDADFNYISTDLQITADDAAEAFADERAREDNPTDSPPPPADPNGTENDDILSGGNTAELFDGLGGIDTISAGGGNDILVGGLGADALDGGDGFDFASYKDAASGVIVRLTTGVGTAGEADGDTLVNIEGLVGSEYGDELTTALTGGALFGLGGDDSLRGSGYFSGGDGNDVLIVTPGAPGTTMFGDAGNDTLAGGHGTDLMFGGEGDDILDPGFGGNNTDDQLYGGNGNDTVTFDKVHYTRSVTVDLAEGAAVIEGREGTIALDGIENVQGTRQDDAIGGDAGANVLDGKMGNDVLSGRGGDDTLKGGEHDDTLDGGSGDDQLYGDAGNDTIYGGSGIDTAHFALSQADYTFSWANGFIAVTNGAGETDLIGNDVEFFNFAGNVVAYYDIYQTLPGVLLANDDTVSVAESETVIINVFANDQIPDGVTPKVTEIAGHAVSVWDTVTIAPGVKATLLENGFIRFDPSGQYDSLNDGESYTGHIEYKITDGAGAVDSGTISVTVEGETNPVVGGPTTIDGTSDSDIINGTNRDETINAGTGNDYIYAGGGNDTIYGGAGDDMMIGYGGQDSYDGGEGSDTVNYSYTDIFLEIDLIRGGATAAAGGAIAETFVSVENVIGTDGNNNIFGDNGANTLSGRGGNDDIRGKGGDDILDGGAGDDTLSGGDGNDLIYAGIGGDSFDGGAGIDTLDFSYTSLDLVFDMTAGTLGYGTASETATGFENGIGGAGDNTLIGNSSENILNGGAGDDTLNGGDGSDWIYGGTDADALFGGAGADRFVFAANTPNTGDVVHDYSVADDILYFAGSAGALTPVVSGNDVIIDGVTVLDAALGNVRVITQQSTTVLNASNAELLAILNAEIDSISLAGYGAFTLTEYDVNMDESWSSDAFSYTVDGLDYRYLLNDDGSSLLINIDQTNSNSWSEIQTTRDTNNMITNVVTTLDTGASSSEIFDVDNVYAWQISTTGRSATNATDYNDITYDDGTRTFTDYDQDNALIWTTSLTFYNDLGQQTARRINYDDGRFEVIYQDVDSTQTWSTKVDTYTDGVNRDYVNFYNDDGTRTTVDFDQLDNQTWSSKTIQYDVSGNATSFIEYNDDGTYRSKVFDPNNANVWDEILIVYDTAGAQDYRRDDYDDGTYLVRDFDNLNTEAWDTHYMEYDANDNLVQEFYI